MAEEVKSQEVIASVGSAWTSKINWTQVAGAGIALIVALGLPLDESTKNSILVAVPVVQGLITWLFRTYFTKTILSASV